jgi:hypothetical protein
MKNQTPHQYFEPTTKNNHHQMQNKSIPFFITNLTKKDTEADPHMSRQVSPTPTHSSPIIMLATTTIKDKSQCLPTKMSKLKQKLLLL